MSLELAADKFIGELPPSPSDCRWIRREEERDVGYGRIRQHTADITASSGPSNDRRTSEFYEESKRNSDERNCHSTLRRPSNSSAPLEHESAETACFARRTMDIDTGISATMMATPTWCIRGEVSPLPLENMYATNSNTTLHNLLSTAR